jgi:uncharacterized membrane protein (DUF4010 family)
MCCERGQASVEWTGVVLLVAVVFGALVTVVTVVPAVGRRADGNAKISGVNLLSALYCR